MEEIYLYAGNMVTGEVDVVTIPNDEDCIDYALDNFREEFGEDHLVWAIYDVNNENADVDFNNYLDEQYNIWCVDMAS